MAHYLAIPKFISCKELAQLMGLSPVSVVRWAKRLGVEASIPGHSSHRWTPDDAQVLVARWQLYWLNKRKDPTYEWRNPGPTGQPTLKPTHPTPGAPGRPPGATHPTPSPTPRR